LRPFSVVESVTWDERQGRVRGVRVIDANTNESSEFEGRVVFLCASALESVRILLNSRSTRWPDGMANSSGTLGRYVMDHTMGGGAEGRVDGFEDRKETGRRPNGVYLARFRNVTDTHADFVRGYGYQGGAHRSGWQRGQSMTGFGEDFKRTLIETYGPWTMRLYGFGECLPRADNVVSLDPQIRDRWGIPALHIDVTYGPNERAQLADMKISAAEMLEAAGVKDINEIEDDVDPGLVIHEMGGARMSKTADEGVLNGWNQAWDAPNLFVTDGACMASSANQNPSITYMALTARAVDHAAGAMNRGEL
jgi:choline dehydrogenase-like flavoprotein